MNYQNKKLSLTERKTHFKREVLDKQLNPSSNFDPTTFDPMDDNSDEYKFAKRERKDPPRELPTMGMKPKEILEGQMIGMYESKQDLYLLFANKFNELQKRIDELEKKLIN
jgi:hypothetical protein